VCVYCGNRAKRGCNLPNTNTPAFFINTFIHQNLLSQIMMFASEQLLGRRTIYKREDNIKIDLEDTGYEDMD
jgi:hypothetical protein